MAGTWRLTVREAFSASHQLRNYCGKCERLHGHNFEVAAVVRGSRTDPDTGMLLDFKDLRAALKSVLETLDHSHLNEVPPFDAINPSSEHLARHIHQGLAAVLPDHVALVSVEVQEKPGQSATYSEE